jgi:hypothetical protein
MTYKQQIDFFITEQQLKDLLGMLPEEEITWINIDTANSKFYPRMKKSSTEPIPQSIMIEADSEKELEEMVEIVRKLLDRYKSDNPS